MRQKRTTESYGFLPVELVTYLELIFFDVTLPRWYRNWDKMSHWKLGKDHVTRLCFLLLPANWVSFTCLVRCWLPVASTPDQVQTRVGALWSSPVSSTRHWTHGGSSHQREPLVRGSLFDWPTFLNGLLLMFHDFFHFVFAYGPRRTRVLLYFESKNIKNNLKIELELVPMELIFLLPRLFFHSPLSRSLNLVAFSLNFFSLLVLFSVAFTFVHFKHVLKGFYWVSYFFGVLSSLYLY